MTNEEREEAAREFILGLTEAFDYADVREHLSEHVGDYSKEDLTAVLNLACQADVSVTFN